MEPPPPPNSNGGVTEAFLIQAAEAQAVEDPRYPLETSPREQMRCEFVLSSADKSILHDASGQPITVDRLLSTKPLRSDLHTRKGPGGRNLVYYNGETVSRLLNEVFGYDGWNMAVLKTEKICCAEKDGKFSVGFMAHVRITHRNSGTFKEDMGSGDAVDRSLPTAVQNAVKGAITDAMKRAARHFGEKLGNSLYSEGFSLNGCPKTISEALDQYDRSMTNRWGASMQFKDPHSKKLSPSSDRSSIVPQATPPIRPPLQQQQTNSNHPPMAKQSIPPLPPQQVQRAAYPNPSNATVVSDATSMKNAYTATTATPYHQQAMPLAQVPRASVAAPVIPPPEVYMKRPESSYGHRPTTAHHVQVPPQLKKPKLNPYS